MVESVVELGCGDERAAAEGMIEGVEDDSGKYREYEKSIVGVPGGSVESHRKRSSNGHGDKEQEYFSDGLAEEIINALAQIPGLKVIARTSAFAFRGKEQDITKIAEALRVRTILEGSVRKSGKRIRITAQLIDAGDGSHLWSERYDRDMTDVFTIQDEISQVIAEKLRVKLVTGLWSFKHYTQNAQAYDLYLMGHYHFLKFTPEGLSKCKEYCERALALDPKYALAWCQVAEFHRLSGQFGFMPLKEANEQCRKAVGNALKLDETLAYAHAVMAVIQAGQFDWKNAESKFLRALELQPESEDVLCLYTLYYLIPMRRLEEALALAQKALERNPLSIDSLIGVGEISSRMHLYDQAAVKYRKVLEIDPHYWLAFLGLGQVYILTGNVDDGVRTLESAGMLLGNIPLGLALLGRSYALANRVEDAKKVLRELQERDQKMHVPAMAFAMVYHGLGEVDKAIAFFEKAIDEEPQAGLATIAFPFFDSLHSNMRWKALLRKMNLEP
jgi:TolB-like protein/Tfp pilus assembly protein PilF